MLRVLLRLGKGSFPMIQRALSQVSRPGNAMVLDAQVPTHTIRMQVRSQGLVLSVIA